MANTAQANQPLIQHPLPWGIGRLLGGGSTLVEGVAPNTDALLVPPPAASPNGQVLREIDARTVLLNNTAIGVLAGAGNFALVYKAEGANEAVFGVSALALAAGGVLALIIPAHFLLSPTDRGIFLRLADLQEGGPVDFTGTLDAYVGYFDTRDIERFSLDLTTDYQVALAGVQGKSLLLGRDSVSSPSFYSVVANFDNIDHTVEARLTDGVSTIQLPQATTVVPAGTMLGLPVGPLANLQEGWELRLSMTVAAAVRPCRAILGATFTNLSPVRTNQAGAY